MPAVQEFYTTHHESTRIICVSNDATPDEAAKYFAETHGDWMSLDWTDGLTKQLLARATRKSTATSPTRYRPALNLSRLTSIHCTQLAQIDSPLPPTVLFCLSPRRRTSTFSPKRSGAEFPRSLGFITYH